MFPIHQWQDASLAVRHTWFSLICRLLSVHCISLAAGAGLGLQSAALDLLQIGHTGDSPTLNWHTQPQTWFQGTGSFSKNRMRQDQSVGCKLGPSEWAQVSVGLGLQKYLFPAQQFPVKSRGSSMETVQSTQVILKILLLKSFACWQLCLANWEAPRLQPNCFSPFVLITEAPAWPEPWLLTEVCM